MLINLVSPPRPSSVRQIPVILTTTPHSAAGQTRRPTIPIGLVQVVALLLLLPALSRAQVLPQETEREPLGSLTLSPRSQVHFSGKYEYAAELEAGAVVMNSVSGPNGFTLRIGNDVLVPSMKEHTVLASIDRAPDGSFLVTCSDGALGVLTLQGTSGQFLQLGQSVSVAPNGQLFPVVQQAATPGKSLSLRSSSGAQKAKGSRTGWGFLGLGAAGAVGAAAALSHGGGKQSISPSSP